MTYRVIPVSEMQSGDIVQPGPKPQKVIFVKRVSDRQVEVMLDGWESPRLESIGVLYKLIKRASEKNTP